MEKRRGHSRPSEGREHQPAFVSFNIPQPVYQNHFSRRQTTGKIIYNLAESTQFALVFSLLNKSELTKT